MPFRTFSSLCALLLLCAIGAHAQDSLPNPSVPPPLTQDQLKAVNTRIRSLQKTETIGNWLFASGLLVWVPFAVAGDGVAATTGFFTIWAAQEVGLGMDYYANTQYRSLYESIGGEDGFLRNGAPGFYLFAKTLTFGGGGLLIYGRNTGKDDDVLLGGAAMFIGDMLGFWTWRLLHTNNRELISDVKSWNLNAGLTPSKGLELALVRRF
jgi:hypothetical protein